ncbi:hypothetical protein OSB04_002976, partial [Centaurea solstitialis]
MTKHVKIDTHFVGGQVRIGTIRVLHVPTKHQYVVIFTKGLLGHIFTHFQSSLSVRRPIASFKGTVLDGHALMLRLCHVKNGEKVKEKVDKDQNSTKLTVRNVTFEVTEKELRKLFSL